jgi:ubiquinone/menaquinone biosynthesis C-methylase UbiE
MAHRFPGREKARLKDERRREVQPAQGIIARMSSRASEVCVDLGSGPGYITVPLSRLVSRVIAIDVQREMLNALMDDAGERDNIAPVVADAGHIPLMDASVDRFVLVNVLHEFEDAGRTIDDIARILRPGGRVSLVDFPPRPTSMGPPVDERIDIDEAVEMFSRFRVIGRWELSEYYQLEMERT